MITPNIRSMDITGTRCLSILLIAGTTLPYVHAQLNGDPAQLLIQHYGGKPTGTPPTLRWQPGPDEAAVFEEYMSGPVLTTVDTTFIVGGSELIVFFRTQVPRDADLGFCESCSDRIDMARMGYDDQMRPSRKEAFVKGLLQQGTLEGQPKPELVLINNWPVAVKFISTEGYMESNTKVEHYFSFPELKPILQVNTQEFLEERGGPYGPMSTLKERSVRFIPEDDESNAFFEVEVADMEGAYPTGTVVRYQWSEAEHRFVAKAGTPGTAPTKK